MGEGRGVCGNRTCLFELSHVGINQRQAGLAVLPSLESSRILIPSDFLPCDAVLSKHLVAMLLSKESAYKQQENWLFWRGQRWGEGACLLANSQGLRNNRISGFPGRIV